MFLMVLLLTLGIVLWMEYSFTKTVLYHEGFVNGVVPIAFPNQGEIKIPSNIQPQNGPLQVLGPANLGVQDNRYVRFSTEPNKATIGFWNNGQQGTIESTGGTGNKDGNLRIVSSQIALQAPVSMKNRLDAPKAQFGSLKVNRTDTNPYVSGWGDGIHTTDVYANGTVGVGQNGGVSASMNSGGNIQSDGTASLNNIRANSVTIANRNVLNELNDLRAEFNRIQDEFNGVRGRVNNYNIMF